MKALIEAVKEKLQIPISFESVYATTLATLKIHESINTNTAIDIPQPSIIL
jgi:hypothetical protein